MALSQQVPTTGRLSNRTLSFPQTCRGLLRVTLDIAKLPVSYR